MRCERAGCPRDIREGARQGTRFCSDVCRAAEHRRQKLLIGDTASADWSSENGESVDPVAALALAAHQAGDPQTEDGHAELSHGKTRKRRRRSAHRGKVGRAVTEREGNGRNRTPRIPYDQQLRSQAPDGAVGYRLVLPLRLDRESPVIIPKADANGGLRYYRLDPLELPEDLRLRDGHSYRILWVDSQGQPMAPRGTQSLPALHVFFGNPDPIPTDEEKQLAELLADITDPELREVFEFEAAKFRMAALKQRVETEQLRVQSEAQLAARKQAQQISEQEQRLAIEREAANRKSTLEEREAARRRDERNSKQWRKLNRKAERDALIARSAREQERRQIRDSMLMMGLTLGLPILAVTIALVVRSAKGLPLDDETFDNLKKQVTDAMEKMAAAAREPTPQAEQSAAAQSKTGTPSAGAKTSASATSQANVDALLERLRAAHEEVLRRTKPQDTAAPASESKTEKSTPEAHSASNEAPQSHTSAAARRPIDDAACAEMQQPASASASVMAAENGIIEKANQPPPEGPTQPAVEQKEGEHEENQPISPQQRAENASTVESKTTPSQLISTEVVKSSHTSSVLRSLFDPEKNSPQHFHFDYFRSSELPRNWREKGKTPLTRRGTVNLYCWLHRPECLSAVIAEITGSDPEFEPGVPLLEDNDRLTPDERDIVEQIVLTPKALTFAIVLYEKRKPGKNRAKLEEYVVRKYERLSTLREQEAQKGEQPEVTAAVSSVAPVHWEFMKKFTLSDQEGSLIASIITNADRLLQLDYEQQRTDASKRAEELPTEPLLSLSPDDRKRIRKLVQEERLREASNQACKEFEELCQSSPESLLTLPKPIEPLKPQDVKLLQELARDKDRSTLFQYYLSCQDNLRSGQTRPSLPETKLTGKAQKELAKLALDRRQVAYFLHLMRQMESEFTAA